MLGLKIAATGVVVVAFVVFAAWLCSVWQPKEPSWFKATMGSLLLAGVTATLGGLVAAVWGA